MVEKENSLPKERQKAVRYRVNLPVVSPLTRRILIVNILALAILLAGFLYLGRYEQNLIDAKFQALTTEAEIIAGALGHGAHGTEPSGRIILLSNVASDMLRRLVLPTRTRARLFNSDKRLLADSRILLGPEGASVQVIILPPPEDAVGIAGLFVRLYEGVLERLPGRRHLTRYVEHKNQRAGDYSEVTKALSGDAGTALRSKEGGGLVISVAVPVQRFKQVLGAVMLTTNGAVIDDAVRTVRFDIVKIFGIALAITILLSLYLARSIVRPLFRLAEAADRVRTVPGRDLAIPELGIRKDEIGALARNLNAMTDALDQRLIAIERFAADVAHEIKNPLTSLRSAVETAARLDDPKQQRKLMNIIKDDVQRLDRLITDISDASRLDAELSRVEHRPFDLGRVLSALVEVHKTTSGGVNFSLEFQKVGDGPFDIIGMEDRLVQVFQNLLTNAYSFSPDGGQVTVLINRKKDQVIAMVEDEGSGIPENSTARIFERFYSERPEGEQFGTHSGLGLSISRQIVDAHGGAIRAENRTDRMGNVIGACFIVTLPAVC